MAVCESCGRRTFGRVCGVCKEHGTTEGPLRRAQSIAGIKGLDILWSPANQAWIVIDNGNIKLLAVKNDVLDVLSFVEDYDA